MVVNGRFAPELSRPSGLPAGVRVGSLAAALTRPRRRRRSAISASSPTSTRSAFAALNTAFATDGAFVYIPDGVVLEQPIQILFVVDRRRRPADRCRTRAR